MLTDSELELVLSSAKIVQAASIHWNQTLGCCWELLSLEFLDMCIETFTVDGQSVVMY